MAEHNELGKAGETLAIKYLKDKGYEILHTNWRHLNFEIDIIAKKNNVISVVEVKARRTNFFGEPEEFVNKTKQKFLIKAADAFVMKNDIQQEIRFDIISILFNNKKQVVNFIEDAFYPTLK